VTIPARLFTEFVSSLPSGNLDLQAENNNLSIKTPHYESHLNGISAEEYPLIPSVEGKPILVLPISSFREALQRVVPAASLDETRPILSGVYIHKDEDELVIAATDSYRLAERRIKLTDKPEGELELIVPARTINELIRILGDGDGNVEIYLDDNQVMFRVEEVELVSRLIEGQFPNYQQIIPKETVTGFEIESSEFSRITKVASLFARENNGSIRLEIKAEGEVRLISSDSEVGGNVSSAECEALGEDGEIALNVRYLADALSSMQADRIQFAISGKLNPCILRPIGRDSKSYFHIIMPLRT